MPRSRTRAATKLEQAVGTLSQAAISKMDREYPWFHRLSAEHRSWIGLIAQSGIAAFVKWYREPKPGPAVPIDVFSEAPPELMRVVSLHQTVEMVRTTIEIVEERVDQFVDPDDVDDVRLAVLLYAREVAFAAAEVYAHAAELRGAWDARLEALVVDSVLRGEADDSVRSRASALGWESSNRVIVVLGQTPDGPTEPVIDAVRRSARHVKLDALCAVQGDRLVVILGGVNDPDRAADAIAAHFGPGPLVYGPLVADLLSASVSARAAGAGLRAAPAWPGAPRPVASDDLLPERALSGDGHARRQMVTDVYQPLAEASSVVLQTVAAFLEHGSSIEATARRLYVHPNTVRYRLKRAATIVGLSPTDPREAHTLRIALTLGRLQAAEH